MGKTILLTGRPGVGKTTVVREVIRRLPGHGGGFYTEEIRRGGRRVGFRIVTVDGGEGVLAHVDVGGRWRVGRYGVDVAALEAVGVEAIRVAVRERDFVVVDEIGKMELFSPAFKDAVRTAIESEAPVLGTIMLRPHPWADAIKARPQVSVVEVTRANRDHLISEIAEMFPLRPGAGVT